MTQSFTKETRRPGGRAVSSGVNCFTLPLLCVLLLGLAAGCGRSGPAAPTTAAAPGRAPHRVVLQTDWFPQGEHGGFYQALAKGFYAEAGLAVEIWPGGPGSGIKLKVLRGDADFGMIRSDDALVAAGRGLPLVMVAAVLQHDPMALMVHAASPVRTLADLGGRAVIGNVGMAYLPYLEKRYGITIERRQNTFGLGEFMANPDAIQQCMLTNEPFFVRHLGRGVRLLPLADSGYDCYHTLFTRRELLRQSPELVRAFVQASVRGWRDYLTADPAPAHALILERNPQSSAALLSFARSELIARSLVSGDAARGEAVGGLSVPRIAREIATLRDLGILEQPVRPDEVVTTAFVSRAAATDRP